MRRDGGKGTRILIIRKKNFWARRTDNPNRIESPQQISIYAQAIWQRKSPVSEAIVRKIEQILPRRANQRRAALDRGERLAKRHPRSCVRFTSAFGDMQAWPGLLAVRPRREWTQGGSQSQRALPPAAITTYFASWSAQVSVDWPFLHSGPHRKE